MVVQCAAVPLCLLSLSDAFLASLPGWFGPDRFRMLRDVTVWATIGITVYSGVEYTWRAFRMLAEAPA
jgi:CDP-diacylglycerol--glycerol-3-phosphate 3-phosphatidyltransferase